MHRSSKLVFSYQWMTLWFFLSLIFLTWQCILSNVGIVNLNILLVFVWLLILEVLLSFPTCIYFFLSYLFLENVFQSPFSAFQESSAYFQMFLDYFSSLGVNFPCGYPLSTLSWVHFILIYEFCGVFCCFVVVVLCILGPRNLSYIKVLILILLMWDFISLSMWHNSGTCIFYGRFFLFITTETPNWKYIFLLHLKMNFLYSGQMWDGLGFNGP